MVVAQASSLSAYRRFMGDIYILSQDEGGRRRAFFSGYQPQFAIRTADVAGTITLPPGVELAAPGSSVSVEVELEVATALEQGTRFSIHDGGLVVAFGIVTELLDRGSQGQNILPLPIAQFVLAKPRSAHVTVADTAIDRQHGSGGFGAARPGQKRDSFRDIFGVDFRFEHIALRIELAQVFDSHAVLPGAGFLPLAVPDAAALNHGVRQHGVNANAEWTAFFGKAARHVDFGSFGGAIGGCAFPGGDAVLAADKDHRAADTLRFHDL